jgi:hypothetical protein
MPSKVGEESDRWEAVLQEAPTKFEFVVNFRTAALLGFTVPASILLRADEVID